MGIKLKMTLWYTILALVTAGLMGGLLFFAAQRSAYEYYSDTLHAASALAQSQLEYESGNLEIDDDLEDIPDVHIALYTESGTLIYGRTRVELAFEQDAVRRVSSGGMEWYALDTLLTFDGRSSVWMRCVKAADSEAAAYVLVLRVALILLPLMIGLTALGGFLIARGAFRPGCRARWTACWSVWTRPSDASGNSPRMRRTSCARRSMPCACCVRRPWMRRTQAAASR